MALHRILAIFERSDNGVRFVLYVLRITSQQLRDAASQVEILRSIDDHRISPAPVLVENSGYRFWPGLSRGGPVLVEQSAQTLSATAQVKLDGQILDQDRHWRAMLRIVAGRPAFRCLLVSYFLAASLRCARPAALRASRGTPPPSGGAE